MINITDVFFDRIKLSSEIFQCYYTEIGCTNPHKNPEDIFNCAVGRYMLWNEKIYFPAAQKLLNEENQTTYSYHIDCYTKLINVLCPHLTDVQKITLRIMYE